MIALSKFQNVCVKKIGTKLYVFTRYIFTIPIIFKTGFKIHQEKQKKDKSDMNSVIKR
jgi:hypothetical protein